MIVDLPDTTTSAVSKALVGIREEGGAVALGRVLTLVIASTIGEEEEAIEAANDASREHPMRVIVVSTDRERELGNGARARLDAQIRVGGDAGASEVLVLKARGEIADDEGGLVMGLLLPDAPVVAWWPQSRPAVPSQSALGRIAQRRITDASASPVTEAAIRALTDAYRPGDTDFAWTRLTLWRAQLAAVLDQPPYSPVTSAEVVGTSESPSNQLLAGWLAAQLQVPVSLRIIDDNGPGGIRSVRLHRPTGTVSLERSMPGIAELTQPGLPSHDISLPRRPLRDCLAEELRRLDPDEVYGAVVRNGLGLISVSTAGGTA